MNERNEGGCGGAGEGGATYRLRACCSRGLAGRAGFLEPVDLAPEESAADAAAGGGAVIAEAQPWVRSWSTAVHEASHAIVTVLMGGGIARVRLDPPSRSARAAPRLGDPVALMVLILAGEIGERWAERWVRRPFDHELAPAIAAVRLAAAGGCDECKAMKLARFAVIEAGGDDEDDAAVFAAWRAAEARAIEIVTDLAVFAAIRRLADVLMTNGIADEGDVWESLGEGLKASPWPKVETEKEGEST